MTVLRQEQVQMMDEMVRAERVSRRQAAALLRVTEGALRYLSKCLANGARDRRAEQPTAVAGFEAALDAAKAAVAPTAPEGRPICGRLVFDTLVRDHGYTWELSGADPRAPATARALIAARGAPGRAPPGMQA